MKVRASPYWCHAWVALAYWPAWRWVFARNSDGTAEGLGMVSWIFALALVASRVRVAHRRTEPSSALVVFWVLSYAFFYPFVPPIIRAFLALTGVAVWASLRAFQVPFCGPLWGLLVLGLPIEASLQFYLGYPLRIVATELASSLLHGLGFAVTAQGTELVWGTLEIAVDAPCSGVGILRMALVSACALALLHNVSFATWLAATILTAVLAVLANALRSASLFLLEGRLLGTAGTWDGALHQGAGVVLFLGLMVAQSWALTCLARTRSPALRTA